MNQVDYDIHGVVGVRLLDATPSDVAAVGRLFGPVARGLIRPPDIVIRYVPRLPARTLQHIQIDRTRFSSAGDCVLGNASGSQASLALDQVGQRCEIVCEHGIGEVPLLVPIVHLSALSKGVVAVHGSAVVHRGAGLLMAAWAHGGKTTGMLAFMAENAEFIGDEWILIYT